MRSRRHSLIASAALLLAACAVSRVGSPESSSDAGASPDAGADAGPDLSVWPNVVSFANSDPWIAAHHDALREMRPRVLALNFVNGRSNADMESLLHRIFDGLAEGSRYHGYSDASAPAFLHYEIAKSVDLTDHPPPSGWTRSRTTR